MKQQWHDFNAYYNTFYNANQYFEEGLSDNQRQTDDINPNDLIRIHPPPGSAGADQFALAIEKSSDILRRHARSGYVDDAIELIGISYFYRREFFAAQEKFQELNSHTDDPVKRASAIIWEGRAYIELGLYNEGVRFMEVRIEEHGDWIPSMLAEARAVLSQLYTYQQNLFVAGNNLLLALDDFEGQELRPRAWFHYGQIMERIGNLEQAAYVFSEIVKMRTSLSLEYHSRLKEIDIYRRDGDLAEAENQLYSMSRDDKYYEHRLEIIYEIGRTEQIKGELESAREEFNRVIHTPSAVPSPELKARTYYGLADLYRNGFGDYETASAYYDSAAAIPADTDLLPPEWDADKMAQAFGEYTAVRRQVQRLDSLLTLGKLPESEFEERIKEIEAQLLARQEAELLEREMLEMGMGALAADNLETTTDEAGRYGFLNVNDAERLQQSSQRFLMVWGYRPLADNWRIEDSFAARPDQDEQDVVIPSADIIPESSEEFDPDMQLQVDLTGIPFDEASQEEMQVRIYRNIYRLGNIYLMNLNMPDSARVYFERVFRESPEEGPKESSLYALADMALNEGDENEALHWAQILVEQYPDSRQAKLIAERMELSLPEDEEAQFPPGVSPGLRDSLEAEGIQEWIHLAEEAASREESADILFRAAGNYILAAAADPLYEARQRVWQQLIELARENPDVQSLIEGAADSVLVEENLRLILEQSQLIAADLEEEGLPAADPEEEDRRDTADREEEDRRDTADPEADRFLTRESLLNIYPYSGEFWDSARILLNEIVTSYPGTQGEARADILLEEIDLFMLNAGSESF